MNIELASPLDYSQALSKLERGFQLDLDDVRNPAVDPAGLRAAVESLAGSSAS